MEIKDKIENFVRGLETIKRMEILVLKNTITMTHLMVVVVV